MMTKLWERIQNNEPYSLAVNGHPEMTEMAIAFSEEETYTIDLTDTNAHSLVQNIFDTPHEMITYNWKEHARAMLWWLTYA